jgi:LAO/AO transport system kinase
MTTDIDALVHGVQEGDRRTLARAITLVESGLSADLDASLELLNQLHSAATSKDSIRIGITGVPGVGKSTFINAFGEHMIQQGLQVAVLAIDPTSTRSGGSILGDKTRMEQLSRNPQAFIRPTPGGLHPGGVARRTRDTIALCEAAGFDAILVETIGVGQSEVSVADIVDTVVLLTLAGAGDDLQGIKRGIMELADVLVIHKSDGDNQLPSRVAASELANVINLLPRRFEAWQPTIDTCSSLSGQGIPEVFSRVQEHRSALGNKTIREHRREQSLRGFDDTLRDLVINEFLQRPEVAQRLGDLQAKVRSGELHPTAAAVRLLTK